MAEDNNQNNEELESAVDAYAKNLHRLFEEQNRYGGNLKKIIAKQLEEYKNVVKGTKDYAQAQNKFIREIKDEYSDLQDGIRKGKKSSEDLWEAADEFEKAIKHASSAEDKRQIQEMRSAATRAAAEKEILDGITNVVSTSTASITSGTSSFIKSLESNAAGTQVATGLLSSNVQLAAGASGFLGKSISTFGKGIEKSAVTSELKMLGKGFGTLGVAVSAVTGVVGPLLTFLLGVLSKEIEKTETAFKDLSNAGALFTNGMTEMRDTAFKAELTIDEFATVIKNASSQIATAGMSVTEGSKFVAGVLEAGGKPLRQSMLKLGYSYEEQGALVADVMKDMRGSSRGPLKATTDEVATQTMKYAENLRIISDITGEDAKAKMEQARDTANQLLFQQKLNKLGEKERQNVINAMAHMGKQQAKDFRDVVNFGTVINKSGAIMASQNSAYSKSIRESAALAKSGNLDAEKQRQIGIKYNDQIQKGWMEASGLATANAANVAGAGNDTAEAINEDNNFRKNWTKKSIEAAEKGVKEQEASQDPLTNNLIKTSDGVHDLKVVMQETLTPAITSLSDIMTDLVDIMKGVAKFFGIDIEKRKALQAYGKTEPGKEYKNEIDPATGKMKAKEREPTIYREGKASQGKGGNAASDEAMDFLIKKGWSKEQAAGIVGNLQQESGNFSEAVVSGRQKGDRGQAVGIAQWHPDRQQEFEKLYGKKLEGSSLKEQLEFLHHELTQGKEKAAGEAIKSINPKDVQGIAAIVDKKYERSAGTETAQRQSNAMALLNRYDKQTGNDQQTTQPAQPAKPTEDKKPEAPAKPTEDKKPEAPAKPTEDKKPEVPKRYRNSIGEETPTAQAKPASIKIPDNKQTTITTKELESQVQSAVPNRTGEDQTPEQTRKNLEAVTGKTKSNPELEAQVQSAVPNRTGEEQTPEQSMKNIEAVTGKPKTNKKLEDEVKKATNQFSLAKTTSEILEKGLDTYQGVDISGKHRFRNGKTGDFELRDTGPEEWQKQTYEKEQANRAAAQGMPNDINPKLGQPELQNAQAGVVSTMQQQNEAQDASRSNSDEYLKELAETNKRQLDAAHEQLSHSEKTARYTKENASATKSVAVGVNN